MSKFVGVLRQSPDGAIAGHTLICSADVNVPGNLPGERIVTLAMGRRVKNRQAGRPRQNDPTGGWLITPAAYCSAYAYRFSLATHHKDPSMSILDKAIAAVT